MVLTSTIVNAVDRVPEAWLLLPFLFLQGFPVVSSSLRGSPRPVNALTQGPFKPLPPCWDLEHLRFRACPLRVAYLLPIALQLSQAKAPLFSPNGEPSVGLGSLTLWRGSLQLWYSPILDHWSGGVCSAYVTSLPLLPVSFWFPLYVFSCGNFVC